FSFGEVLQFLRYASRLLHYWPQWEFFESWSLYHAMLLARGESLYRISETPPLVVPQYGFVYPAVVARLLPFFGDSLLAPRLVSFACVLALLAQIAAVMRRLGAPWPISIVALGLPLAKVNWWRWLLLARPDALGTLLLFSALAVHWRWPFHLGALVTAVLLLVAAFFTKVYFVLGAPSLFLGYALVHRDRRWALRFAMIFAAVFTA